MSSANEQPGKIDEAGTVQLVTRTGFKFGVRAVAAADEPALADFFRQVTPDDLRFRFLSAVREVSHARLEEMINVDQERTESFIVTAPDEGDAIVAAAMLAADPAGERAEVAISMRADHKGLGIGWTLLDHLAKHAEAKGVRVLESVESRANRAAISLEREMGFIAEPVEGDSTLVVLRRQLD
ncbi:MAG: GNAT family N-acetyltransferase [Sphingomonadales bacterium 32-64-17]|nr:MAG: GNAT family N-acetyltransferase [Sphingomonadales bacterium 32-64-17]